MYMSARDMSHVSGDERQCLTITDAEHNNNLYHWAGEQCFKPTRAIQFTPEGVDSNLDHLESTCVRDQHGGFLRDVILVFRRWRFGKGATRRPLRCSFVQPSFLAFPIATFRNMRVSCVTMRPVRPSSRDV
jgi:hypothetical protein